MRTVRWRVHYRKTGRNAVNNNVQKAANNAAERKERYVFKPFVGHGCSVALGVRVWGIGFGILFISGGSGICDVDAGVYSTES